MPTDLSKRSVWPTIFARVVVFAVAYGTAYGLLVQRRQWLPMHDPATGDYLAAEISPD